MLFVKIFLVTGALAASQLMSAPSAGVERIPEHLQPATSPTLQHVVLQFVGEARPPGSGIASMTHAVAALTVARHDEQHRRPTARSRRPFRQRGRGAARPATASFAAAVIARAPLAGHVC
jgi:hypothetical protein